MPNLRPDRFVELNRTFSDFQENADEEQAALDSYFAAYSGGGTTWDDLLASPCSVLLAEAGSGKTWELLNQCQTLREEGRTAFFIRLERLAQNPLEDCLILEDKRYLANWRNSSDEGLFFLDAVDEAKLTTHHAFETALQSFVNGIGVDGVKRVRLVVTSRIIGWRTRDDRALLRNLFDLGEAPDEQGDDTNDLEDVLDSSEKSAKAQPLRIVTMNVLSTEQVERLARHVVPERADNFLAALNAHDAWSFARRPQDVERLAAYWQQTSTFGNLTDLLKFDIRSRLRETDEDRQRDSDLTDDQLREGAEALAAAVVFGKIFSIRLENEPTGGVGEGNVVPSKELSNWTSDQHRDLLTRALFDPAAYGLVRFHHRSIAEYLAACWLDRLLGGDLPVSDVLSLFFVRSHGEEVLIPSRAAVACWLACSDNLWNQRIRGKLLEISPEALLEHGDGTRLDSATRETLLRAIVAKTSVEGGVRVEASNDQLKRLAHTDIAPTVTEILIDPETPEESLLLLLRIVREGTLGDCVPAAMTLAHNPLSLSHAITYATAAIASAGNAEEKERFVSDLLVRPEIDERVACQVVTELYPDSLSPDALVRLAEKTRSSGRMTFPDFSETATRTIVAKSPENDLESLLHGFVALLNQRPGITVDNRNISFLVSRDHIWLTPVLRAIVSRAFAQTVIGDDLAEKIVEALFLIELAEEFKQPFESRKVDLQESSFAHPFVRRLFCWRKADKEILRKPNAKISIHGIFKHDTPFEWSERDISWMLDDLDDKHSYKHRETALQFTRDLWWFSGRPKGVKAQAYHRIRNNRYLRRLFRKEFQNVATMWLTRTRSKIEQYVKLGYRLDFYKITKQYWRWRNMIWLLLHLRSVKRGRRLRTLIHLHSTTEDGSGRNKRGSLEAIAKWYNGWIAAAYKDGCIAYWRTFSPQLRHEKDEPNKTLLATIVGQEGLRFDFEGGLDATTLSAEEAERATRYAVEEMNKFSEWFPDLVRAHPMPVQSVLISCIEGDWPLAGEHAWGSGITSRLHRVLPSLQRLMAPGILGILRNADPGSPRLLLYAVGVVLRGDPKAKPDITRLAANRLDVLSLDSELAAPWLIIWLWLDAVAALVWLENTSSAAPVNEVDDLFLAVGDWMERDSLNPKLTDEKPSYHDQAALTRLLRLCYRHVRTDDDIDRFGLGMTRVTPRDHAQEFRDALITRLTNTPGPEAHAALLDLADDPALVSHREYILRSAASRRRLDAEPDAWRPGDAAAFANSFIQPVRSGNDLFALTMRHIRQLKDDLEDADFRRREGLPTDGNEDRLQVWLARYFHKRSSDQYVVYREPVVAHGKKPDLRLETPSYPPTSIEVKWADGWSYNQLSEALSDQLVGRYMRARRSRHGVLLLGWRGTKKRWKADDGTRLAFPELVIRLNDEGASILEDRWDIDGLTVIGANFAG